MRRLTAAVCTVLVAVAVAGCDSGGGDDAGGTTTTSADGTGSSTTVVEGDGGPPTLAADSVTVGRDAERLVLESSTLTDVKATATPALGSPTAEQDESCDSGADHSVTYGPLQLYFIDEELHGWYVDAPGPRTADGIEVGATRADLERAFADLEVHESTLGTEFTGEGISGLLSDDAETATVEVMWSGAQCVAR